MNSWTKAQKHELEWWTNNNVDPRVPWRYYDLHFIHELQEKFGIAVDVGSGPVSYLHNHNVRYECSCEIDPLTDAYHRIKKFDRYRLLGAGIASNLDIDDYAFFAKPDAIFCLNMLDHVQDPIKAMQKIMDLLQDDGKLFLFCDLDKKTDWMHPHRLPIGWFETHVFPHFHSLVCDVEKSWKFSNDVLYYVGRKR